MSNAPSRSTPDNPAMVRTSAGTNTAWLAVGSIAAVVTLFFGVVQVVGLLAHEERNEVVTIADPAVTVLDVASDVGRVEIIGANVTDIRISAHVSDGMVATNFRHRVVGDRLEVRYADDLMGELLVASSSAELFPNSKTRSGAPKSSIGASELSTTRPLRHGPSSMEPR